MKLGSIFENNRQWIAQKLEKDERYFDRLAEGQSPEILYIGCSDSRAVAEEMMGANPGEIFVHRNIANIVTPHDPSAMSILEYAVEHLRVRHVIVCGHYECGGVKAAMGDEGQGVLNRWLHDIRLLSQKHSETSGEIRDFETRYKKLVELNIIESCRNVAKTALVQKAFRERMLQVHGWVFDIHTGHLVDLHFNMPEVLRDNITE